VIGQGTAGGNSVIKKRTIEQEDKNAGPFKLKTLHKRNKTTAANTVAGLGINAGKAGMKEVSPIDQFDRKIFLHFKGDLTEEDYTNSLVEIEESIKELSKSALMELRAIAKPHPLIEKTMQILCALRGFKNLSWSTSRDLLGKNSFKIELKQMTAQNMKSEDVHRAQQILVQKTNTLLTPENVQIHSQGAALLLVWVANVIKNYAAYKYLGDELKLTKAPYANLKPAGINNNPNFARRDLQGITIETKLQVREQRRKEMDAYTKAHEKEELGSDDGEEEAGDEDVDDEEKERRKKAT